MHDFGRQDERAFSVAIHGLKDHSTGWASTCDMSLGGLEAVIPEAVTVGRIRAVCGQRTEAVLIRFKPLRG